MSSIVDAASRAQNFTDLHALLFTVKKSTSGLWRNRTGEGSSAEHVDERATTSDARTWTKYTPNCRERQSSTIDGEPIQTDVENVTILSNERQDTSNQKPW